ncbi:MAG: hypothetical protein U5L72_17090 [Bacteroidales bacterium]|nr:hypothetical protein [Bacteroidales bacterium]
MSACFKDIEKAYNIALKVNPGVAYAVPYTGMGSKMNNIIKLSLLNNPFMPSESPDLSSLNDSSHTFILNLPAPVSFISFNSRVIQTRILKVHITVIINVVKFHNFFSLFQKAFA